MDFDKLKEEVFEGSKNLLSNMAIEFSETLKNEIENFVDDTHHDLERWSKALISGDLKPAEYQDLLERHEADLRLRALTIVGIQKENLERVRRGILDVIVTAVFKAI